MADPLPWPWSSIGPAGLRDFREHHGVGIDLRVPIGRVVPSPRAGIIEHVGWIGPRETWDGRSLGFGVVLFDPMTFESWMFGHGTGRFYVKRGSVVVPEQPLMASGNTGHSTGPHVHVERWRYERWPRKGKLLDPLEGTFAAAPIVGIAKRRGPPRPPAASPSGVGRPRGWWYL